MRIVLAMEAREGPNAEDKAERLMVTTGHIFEEMMATYHSNIHKSSSQPLALGDHPNNWRAIVPRTRVTWAVWLCFQVAAGITFQLPRGRDVGPLSKPSGRARLCLLVAVARLVGGWCFWLVCPWCWLVGVVFVSLSEDAVHRTGISAGIPLYFLGLRFLAPEAPSRGQFFVNFVMGLMVGDRRFPGATILGARFSTSSANHLVSVPPTGPEHSDASWCGQCTSLQVQYFLTGAACPVHPDGSFFLCIVTGSFVFWDFGSLFRPLRPADRFRTS